MGQESKTESEKPGSSSKQPSRKDFLFCNMLTWDFLSRRWRQRLLGVWRIGFVMAPVDVDSSSQATCFMPISHMEKSLVLYIFRLVVCVHALHNTVFFWMTGSSGSVWGLVGHKTWSWNFPLLFVGKASGTQPSQSFLPLGTDESSKVL